MESCLSNLPEKHFPRMVYVKPLVFGGVMLLAEIIFFTWCLVLDFWLRSGDNKPVFLVVVEQCLNRVKDFSTSHTALPARRLRAHKELEGDRTRTTNANWLKGCPLLYGVTLSNKSWDIEGMMAFVLPINHYMWWVEKNTSQWEVANGFLISLCLYTQLLLYLLNCLHFHPTDSPVLHGESEKTAMRCWAAC